MGQQHLLIGPMGRVADNGRSFFSRPNATWENRSGQTYA